MFVDRVQIEVQGGRGGKGCVSFRREKFVPRGGPDGGNGGDGGSILIRAETGVNHLAALAHKKHWRGEHGQPGLGSDCHGRAAPDVTIDVPPGTLVIDAATGLVLKDLVHPGESVVAARGGIGGKGNAHFKSANNRAPRDSAPPGQGEQRTLILELKVIADVGLVGKPNAGKSTLLSRLSRARPEIAAYPFTTKHPNLGLVTLDADRSFVMADLPGLIEGASAGVGLGHEFLRHIERAGILVHLVEPEPADGTQPLENYRAIRHELTEYAVELGQRPEIIVISKAELPAAAEVQREFQVALARDDIMLLSAVTGAGLDRLLVRIAAELDQNRTKPQPLPVRIPPHMRVAPAADTPTPHPDLPSPDNSVEQSEPSV
ncbi:MAG: GTPase ObgE [Pirellulales bacterium]|nr:GTPase ObgE [Pirellulales bacterium]